jgi:hypothetical protein
MVYARSHCVVLVLCLVGCTKTPINLKPTLGPYTVDKVTVDGKTQSLSSIVSLKRGAEIAFVFSVSRPDKLPVGNAGTLSVFKSPTQVIDGASYEIKSSKKSEATIPVKLRIAKDSPLGKVVIELSEPRARIAEFQGEVVE